MASPLLYPPEPLVVWSLATPIRGALPFMAELDSAGTSMKRKQRKLDALVVNEQRDLGLGFIRSLGFWWKQWSRRSVELKSS